MMKYRIIWGSAVLLAFLGNSKLKADNYVWNNASGGTFTTNTNWLDNGSTPATGPGTNDSASISLAGTYTVTLAASTSITNLTINNTGTTFSDTGGTFTIGSTLTLQAGLFSLNGGTISGGTLTNGGGSGTLMFGTSSSNSLSGVQIASAGVLNFSTAGGYASFTNGTNFTVASSYTLASNFILAVNQTQAINNLTLSLAAGASFQATGSSGATIGASSDVRAVQTSGSSYVYSNSYGITNSGLIENTSSGTLYAYANGFSNTGTIRNTSPATGTLNVGNNGYPFTNQVGGLIDVQSGTANLSGSWSNAGTINLAAGASLNLEGTFTNAGVGTINRGGTVAGTAGTLSLYGGTLSLGSNLDLSATTGPLLFSGGATIAGNGNALLSSGTSKLIVNNGTLNNVSVGVGSLDLSPTGGVLSLTGGTTFAVGSAYTTGNGFNVSVNQTQPFANVALSLNASILQGAGAATTIDATSDIKSVQASGGYSYVYSNSGTVTNNGLIENTGSGTVNVYAGGGFTNSTTGILRMTSPATGTLNLGSSGDSFDNQGLIDIQSGTGILSGYWSNEGTIKLASGASLYMEGTFNNTSLSNIIRGGTSAGTAGSLYFAGSGTLGLNASIDLNVTTGPVTMTNFTIDPVFVVYSIYTSGSAQLTVGTGTNIFSGVDFGVNVLNLSTSGGSMTLNGSCTFDAGSAYTTGTNFIIQVNQTQAVNNLTLTLGNGSQLLASGSNGLKIDTTSDIRFSGTGTATITGSSGQPVTNNGTVENTSTGTLAISTNSGATFTLNGTVSNDSSGILNIGNTNSSTLTVGSGGIIQTLGGTLTIGSGVTFTNYTSSSQTLSVGTYRAVGNAAMNWGTMTVSTLAVNTTVELGGTATFAAINSLQVNNGTFIVSGGHNFTVSNSANSFTNGGTLTISGGGTFSIPNSITLTNFSSGTLTGGTWNVTSSTLSLGTLAITTIGNGTTVTLTGTASMPSLSSLSTINSTGTLQLLSNQNLSVSGSLSNAGTLVLQGGTLTVPGTFTNTGTLTATGTITSPTNFNTGTTLSITGTLTLGGTLNVNAATTLASGTLNVTGTTTVNSTLTISSGATFGGSGTLTVPMSQSLVVNGTIATGTPISLTGTLSGSGRVNGTLTTSSGASIQSSGGTLALNTLTVNGATSLTGTVNASSATVINNTGVLTVSGSSTFGGTGTITVGSGGQLTAHDTGSTISQPVTIQSGGYANGNGTFSGGVNLQAGGLLKPGNSPGVIVIGGGMMQGGGIEIEIPGPNSNTTGNTTPGSGFGSTNVSSGNVQVLSGAGIVVKTSVALTDPFWSSPQTWLIVSIQSGGFVDQNNNPLATPGYIYTMTDANSNPLNYSGYGAFSSSTFAINSGAGVGLDMVWTPTPEPGVLGLCALSMTTLYFFHRQSRPSSSKSWRISAKSQSLRVPSTAPEISTWLLGLNAKAETLASWACQVASSRPVGISQSRIIRSSPAEARMLSSGLTATASTVPWCPTLEISGPAWRDRFLPCSLRCPSLQRLALFGMNVPSSDFLYSQT